MHITILNKLISEWGTAKVAQVILAGIMGASITALITINIIPNKPESIGEKESD